MSSPNVQNSVATAKARKEEGDKAFQAGDLPSGAVVVVQILPSWNLFFSSPFTQTIIIS
jgi:hypothetical protein